MHLEIIKMRNEFEKYTIEYNLTKDWIFPYSDIEKGSKIVLYGAGDVGQSYQEQIKYTEYCNIIKWVDRKFDSYEEQGMDVGAPYSIVGCEYDYVVIAVYSASIAREINNELLEMGVAQDKIVWIGKERTTVKGTLVERRFIWPIQNRLKEVYRRRGISIEDVELKKYISRIEDKIRKEDILILPRVVIELTPVCTLKCKGCNNLMPFYEKPKHVPKDNVLRDIRKLMGCIDGIVTVELIGGEPFAYPWLKDIVCEIIDYDGVAEVEVTTNGTIVPSEELIGCLKNGKITVNISKYDNVDYKDNIAELLFRTGIRYEEHRELQWIDSGGIESRGKKPEEIRGNYMNCHPGIYCKTLYNGRIYACARSASLYDMGICKDLDGYVDIHGVSNLKEELKKFWLKSFDNSCDYCDFSDQWRVIPAGEQICE